ncbi:MAG TPA: radical SAM/SPASM domain-containing protein [Candidatus Cloacimonadota bacterium]|nr:radical SAM/SPASM domain-containing protein [Candidatus Cloacimonadota bacterium]
MLEYFRMIIKYISFKRLINIVLIYLSYYMSIIFRKVFVWGYPPILMIEPTNICNLKCPLCPSGTDQLKRPKGYMNLDTFKTIIKEVSPYSFMLIMWNQGEPFLNPDFIEMCQIAKAHNMLLLVSTNANRMPDAKEILKAGIDRLIISADGASQETYNLYRKNGDLSKVIENVKAIVAEKKVRGSRLPRIIWQFIVMKHNEHEEKKIKELALDLEVDQLQLKTVQIYAKEDIYNFLPDNPKYRRYKIKGDNFELKYGIKNRCRRIWTQPVVNWDGEMAVCCFDKDNDFKIGNIQNHSFKHLWKSKPFNAMRKRILTDRKQIEMCRNCGEGVSLKIKNKD